MRGGWVLREGSGHCVGGGEGNKKVAMWCKEW